MRILLTPVVAFVLAAPAAVSAAARDPHDTSACSGFEILRDKRERELRDFQKLVVAPLQRHEADIKRALDQEVNEPARLERAIADIRKRVASLNRKKAELPQRIEQLHQQAEAKRAEAERLDQQADEAEQRGDRRAARMARERARKAANQANGLDRKASQAEGELDRVEVDIANAESRVAGLQSQIDDIRNNPPTAAELEAALEEVRAGLADQEKLRRDLLQDRDTARAAVELCVNYTTALGEVSRILSFNGVRPAACPSSPADSEGVRAARRAVGCPDI